MIDLSLSLSVALDVVVVLVVVAFVSQCGGMARRLENSGKSFNPIEFLRNFPPSPAISRTDIAQFENNLPPLFLTHFLPP
jgi:hypothetical protein